MPASDLPAWTNYLDVVPAEDLSSRLDAHFDATVRFLTGLPQDKAGYAYAPGKWTVRQVLGHILISQRIFVNRAACIARGETQPLPGYDENAYAADWPGSDVVLADLARAYAAEAAATASWFGLLRPEERSRAGVANGTRVTPDQLFRALVGHEAHHLRVLRERYGLEVSP